MTTVLLESALYAVSASATTKRSLAARGTEAFNVKDFGAVGDGSTDDTTAIQAALNAAAAVSTSQAAGTTVFFPAGTYKVTAPIKDPAYAGTGTNQVIRLLGVGAANGQSCSTIYAVNLTGYVLDTPDLSPNFTRANLTAYLGGVTVQWTTGTTVWSCLRPGTSAASAPSIVGKVVGDTVADGTVTWKCMSLTLNANSCINALEYLAVTNTSTTAGDGAVRLDRIASGGISNCRFSGFNALHCSGNTFGVYITACSFNSSSGTNGASGSYGCIMGQSEFHACAVVGFDVGMAHYNGSMIVTGGHIEDNNTAILLGMDPTGASNISHNSMLLANSFERNNISINIQNASGGKISANSVTGVVDVAGTGHPSRGISANGVINTMVIDGNTLGVAATVAGIDMTSANGSNVVFVGNQTNVSGAGGSGVEWIMPPNLNAADFTYIGNNNPTAAITFAGLPGQAGVHLSSPIEGMQYDIIDCSTSISTSFLAVAASGGTTSVAAAHRRVRYNATSSNWQVIG